MLRRPVSMSVMALGLALTAGLRAAAPAPAPDPPPAGQQPAGQPPAGQPPASQPPAGQTPATPQQPGAHGEPAPPPRPADGPQEAPRFPAHQRPLAAPEVLERGKAQYAGLCSACHGADARGGQLGGPNLLRSQLVLDDRDGELIIPVVQNGRPGPPPMPPLPVAVDEIKAIAAWLHSLQAQGTNQGGPPPGPETELNILVGDAKAGEAFFARQCASCHSTTGDLQGIATRMNSPMALQNLWVSGGVASGRGPGRRSPNSGPKPVTATVTSASGEKVSGRLLRLDDFLVTIGLEDGTTRTIRRAGSVPRIEVEDPLAKHRELLGVLPNENMHDVTAFLSTLK
jgi:cytochrome c oxidase cbb3-type subunit III